MPTTAVSNPIVKQNQNFTRFLSRFSRRLLQLNPASLADIVADCEPKIRFARPTHSKTLYSSLSSTKFVPILNFERLLTEDFPSEKIKFENAMLIYPNLFEIDFRSGDGLAAVRRKSKYARLLALPADNNEDTKDKS